MHLYYSFTLDFGLICVENVGHIKTTTLVVVESLLKYHPDYVEVLTQVHYLDRGPCVVGSLTGAVSSQRVTEEYEGTLSMVGNHAKRIKA